MKRKILACLLSTSCIMAIIVGCSNKQTTVKASNTGCEMEYIQKCYSDIDEYRDSETGVHYFVYCNNMGYSGAGGICPRYNADGSLYVD